MLRVDFPIVDCSFPGLKRKDLQKVVSMLLVDNVIWPEQLLKYVTDVLSLETVVMTTYMKKLESGLQQYLVSVMDEGRLRELIVIASHARVEELVRE